MTASEDFCWKKWGIKDGRLKECKLKDICDYGKDRIEVSSLDNSNYISTENMLPNRAGITTATTLPTGEYTPSFEIDDTLVSNIRPYFKKIWKATFSGGCSADVLVFKAKENVSKEYLYYVLADDEFFKYSMATSKGTKMPRGDKTSIMNYPVKLPPLPTQQKIAAILSSLDDKIELNNKINTNLEQQAQALFKNWFVDFEPFGGKMPEGWKVGKLEDIADYYNGYAFSSKELLNEPEENCLDVFKQGHIKKGGGFIPDGTKSWYPLSKCQKLKNYILKKGDILMAMTDMKGNVAILGNTAIMPVDDKYIVNQRVGLLRAKENLNIDYPYLYLLTNDHDFLMDLRSRANSGVQVNLSSTAIKESEVNIAPKEVYKQFNDIILPLFEKILANQQENQKLANIRDTLLPKLMNGEIEV